MVGTLSAGEEAQLRQTIEMFEVITQSQPQDYQSLEILKEAYFKLELDQDVVNTSKRIAQAYVQLGQLSSAILEYESILQRTPDDPDVQKALEEIESRASNFAAQPDAAEPAALTQIEAPAGTPRKTPGRTLAAEIDDGRIAMRKVFVDSRAISAGDFDLCWPTPDLSARPTKVVEPFLQVLHDRAVLTPDKSLKLLVEKTRLAYLPLDRYDLDIELSRSFPADTCRRWCVLPIDRLSKSVLVATVNPFNRQAARELEEATQNRLLWYLVPPAELIKTLQKVFR